MSLEINPKNFPHDNLGWMNLWGRFFLVCGNVLDENPGMVINKDVYLGNLHVGNIVSGSDQSARYLNYGIGVPVGNYLVEYGLGYVRGNLLNSVKVLPGRGYVPTMRSYWKYGLNFGKWKLDEKMGPEVEFEGVMRKIPEVSDRHVVMLHEDAYKLALVGMGLVKNVSIPPEGEFWRGVFI